MSNFEEFRTNYDNCRTLKTSVSRQNAVYERLLTNKRKSIDRKESQLTRRLTKEQCAIQQDLLALRKITKRDSNTRQEDMHTLPLRTMHSPGGIQNQVSHRTEIDRVSRYSRNLSDSRSRANYTPSQIGGSHRLKGFSFPSSPLPSPRTKPGEKRGSILNSPRQGYYASLSRQSPNVNRDTRWVSNTRRSHFDVNNRRTIHKTNEAGDRN